MLRGAGGLGEGFERNDPSGPPGSVAAGLSIAFRLSVEVGSTQGLSDRLDTQAQNSESRESVTDHRLL